MFTNRIEKITYSKRKRQLISRALSKNKAKLICKNQKDNVIFPFITCTITKVIHSTYSIKTSLVILKLPEDCPNFDKIAWKEKMVRIMEILHNELDFLKQNFNILSQVPTETISTREILRLSCMQNDKKKLTKYQWYMDSFLVHNSWVNKKHVKIERSV